MLLNRSRLHSAKLKISELKLKYSADPVLSDSEETGDDVTNNDSKNIQDVQSNFQSSLGHEKQNSIHSNPPSREISTENSLVIEDPVPTNKRLIEQSIPTLSLEITQNFSLSDVETDESNSKYGSPVVLSNPKDSDIESDAVSQVLNQLDNLCFISSSSDEKIKTITECSSHKQNLIETTTDQVNDIQIQSKIGVLESSSKQAKTDGNDEILNAILEQSKHSEVGSIVSSELKSMSERDSKEYNYSSTFTDDTSEKSHINNTSYQVTSDMDKAREVSSDSEKSIKMIANLPEREKMHGGSIKDQTKPKRCKFVPYKGEKLKNGDNFTNKTTNNSNNILNEEIVSTKYDFKNNQKSTNPNLTHTNSTQNDLRGNLQRKRKIRSNNVNLSVSSLHQKNPKTKHNIGFNQDVKRPVLKSSRLIKPQEKTQAMFCFPEKQHKVIPKSTEELHNLKKRIAGHENYEEIINNLLLNQIQLTRHFIDSHHKMYLLCCQAAQRLSEGYIREHRGLPTRTPQDKFTTRF